ncbi:MAG: hypothetical protein ACW99Q_16900 [Candidatus Kariarchaeaceae archaeon]|jgi:hypothetical protein
MGDQELETFYINDMGTKTKNFGIFVIFEIIILYFVELMLSLYAYTLGFQQTEIGLLRAISKIIFFQIFLILMINGIGYYLIFKLVLTQRRLHRVLDN